MPSLMDSERKEMADILTRRYEELLDDVRAELEGSGEPRQVELAGRIAADDIGSEPLASLLADISAASLDRYVRELRDIQAARRRLYDGSYGTCLDCGGDIGLDRLRAWPTALRCVDCQEAHDRSYGGQATPSL